MSIDTFADSLINQTRSKLMTKNRLAASTSHNKLESHEKYALWEDLDLKVPFHD